MPILEFKYSIILLNYYFWIIKFLCLIILGKNKFSHIKNFNLNQNAGIISGQFLNFPNNIFFFNFFNYLNIKQINIYKKCFNSN